MMDNNGADTGSSMQHAFRISLNVTRRIVRRMIELDQQQYAPKRVVPRASCVPDEASFLLTLRMLHRVIHRLIEQAEHGSCHAQPA